VTALQETYMREIGVKWQEFQALSLQQQEM
jgi:hypothetical protein